MKISLEGLQILDAISRRGSFAGAAEELCRVPSTITYAVQKLEEDLGVPLFRRNGHRPHLTSAGEELLKEGRAILQATAELEERLKRVAEGDDARLRIVVDGLLPHEPMLELARAFYAEPAHGHLPLRITREAPQQADLVIGATAAATRDGGGYHRRAVGTLEFVLAVSRSHPLAQHRSPLLGQLLRPHRVAVASDTSSELPLRAAWAIGQKTITLPNMQAKLAVLKAGLAIGFVPRRMVVGELQNGALVEIVLQEPPAPETFYVGWDDRPKGKAFAWWLQRLDRANLMAEWLT